MLAAIARALEERDQAQGHGIRVAALAEPVAERLGWEPGRVRELRFGAVVHDIGKVTVRQELLRKRGDGGHFGGQPDHGLQKQPRVWRRLGHGLEDGMLDPRDGAGGRLPDDLA